MRVLVLVAFVASCAAHSHISVMLEDGASEADRAWMSELRRDADDGRRRIEAFFGARFPRGAVVRVSPSRAALDVHWRALFQDPQLKTQCWMVGSGFTSELSILSPAAWTRDACEHDPRDHEAVERLIIHELVHTYHQQLNPRLESDEAAASVAWFLEGVAVYASGQLEDGHLASAREAIAAGKAPAALKDAWTGKYKYGVSGSLVAYVDHAWGRATLVRLLHASSTAEILGVIGVGEAELLTQWRAWVTGAKG